jgi:hypothetical protein
LPHLQQVRGSVEGRFAGSLLQTHVVVKHVLQPLPRVLQRYLLRRVAHTNHVANTVTKLLLLTTQFFTASRVGQLLPQFSHLIVEMRYALALFVKACVSFNGLHMKLTPFMFELSLQFDICLIQLLNLETLAVEFFAIR